MGVCWFVVPRRSGFGVRTDFWPAFRCVFGQDRWPSVSAAFFLAGLETSILLVLSIVCRIRSFFTVDGSGFGIFFWISFRSNTRNGHDAGTVPDWYNWSGTI